MISLLDGKENFDEYLKSKGLSSEQGKRILVKYKSAPPYYVDNGIPAHEELVNPSKIVGYSRNEIVIGESVFDNMFHLCPQRYEALLSLIEKRSVEDFVHFFAEEQSMSISATHLLDTDEYIIENDGHHRSSLAACLGIPKINIKRVYEVVCDDALKQKYDAEVALMNSFNIKEITTERHSYNIKSFYNFCNIYFFYNGEERYVHVFLSELLAPSFEESLHKFDMFMSSVIKTNRFLSKCPSWLKNMYIKIKNPYNIETVPQKSLLNFERPFSFFEYFY